MTIIASAGVAAFPQFRWAAGCVMALVAGLLIAVRSDGLRRRIADRAQRMVMGRLRTVAIHAMTLVDHASRMLGYRALLYGVALGLLAWGAEAIAFAYIVHAIGYPLSVPILAGVYALSMLAGAISFMPGGLGGAEVAMGVMLHALGLEASDVVSATLICRLTTLWFAVALGLYALGSSITPATAIQSDTQ